MANGTPEVFPLRGHPTAIEATWARGTTDAKMVPAAQSLIQIQDNTGKWAGVGDDYEKTWIRGTTNDAMVPAYLSNPPAPPKAKAAAPPKAANVQLEDNTGKWAAVGDDYEKTWIRGTTNDAMVPAYLSQPPAPKKAAAPAKAANIQLEDNVGKWAAVGDDYEKTWIRGTTNDAMVPAYLSNPPAAPKSAAPAKAAAPAKEAAPETKALIQLD